MKLIKMPKLPMAKLPIVKMTKLKGVGLPKPPRIFGAKKK